MQKHVINKNAAQNILKLSKDSHRFAYESEQEKPINKPLPKVESCPLDGLFY